MSAPVEVMEWMRQCAPDEVLAAVAEMIEAATDCVEHGGREVVTPGVAAVRVERLRAALARVQGGAK